MRDLSLVELAGVEAELKGLADVGGFEVHPFKIGWYNESVGEKFALPYSGDTLAFVVISQPSMFEKAFLPFVANNLKDLEIVDESEEDVPKKTKRDPLDECMLFQFSQISSKLVDRFGPVETLHDFELAPNRRPKILVQTAGHVSGAVRFYRPEDCPNVLNRKKKTYPVCLHPEFGGWFALRGVLIFAELTASNLPPKDPPNILESEEEILNLLELYNDHWRDWSFRDVIDVRERYSSDQMEYFNLEPGEKRWHLLRTILSEQKSERK